MAKEKPWWKPWGKPQRPTKEPTAHARDEMEETVDLRPPPKKGGQKRAWWRFWQRDEDKIRTGDHIAVPDPARQKAASADIGSAHTQKLPAMEAPKPSIARAKTEPLARAFDPEQPFPTPPKGIPALPQEATPPPPPPAPPTDPDGLFALSFFLLLIAYSIPLWLAAWFPSQDAPLRMGLAAVLRFGDPKSLLGQFFGVEYLFYLNSATETLLALLSAILPPRIALLLLLQLYVILLPLSLLSLLSQASLPRWNLLWGFFFLYQGIFLHGSLGALLGLPAFFWALSGLYAWMARQETLGGLIFFLASCVLVVFDTSLWFALLLMALLSAFLLASSFSQGIRYAFIASLSAFFLLPSGLGLWASSLPLNGLRPDAPLFTLATLNERISFLYAQSLGLLPHPHWIMICGAAAILPLGLLLGLFQKIDTPWQRRFFFPMLSTALLVILLFAPATLRGLPLDLTVLWAIWLMLLPTWMHLRPHGLSALLVAICLLWSLAHAAVVSEAFWRYGKETEHLVTLLQRVPPKKRLLLWQIGESKHLNLSFHTLGGLYALEQQGLTNLPTAQFPWNPVFLRPKKYLPSPTAPRLPHLGAWDYLLTSQSPPADTSKQLHLISQKGRFRLYHLPRIE